MSQADLVRELRCIKLHNQISVFANKFQEATEAISQVCLDPRKGLTERSLELAKANSDTSFLEEWLGVSPKQFMMWTSLAIVGLSVAGYSYVKRTKLYKGV